MSSELARLIDRTQQGLSELNLSVEEEEQLCFILTRRIKPWIKHVYKAEIVNRAQRGDNG